MSREALIRRLMATFIGELHDHVQAMNRDLLRLERQPPPEARAEIFETLFRTAHSLKGAARSVDVEVVETACHRLEELITALRDGRIPPTEELFRLLFATVDALGETGRQLADSPQLTNTPLSGLLAPLQGALSGKLPPVPRTAADETAPERAAPASAPALSGGGLVRVPAERLDALLAHSSELLVALNRVDGHVEGVESLQERLRRPPGQRRGEGAARRRTLQRQRQSSAPPATARHGRRDRGSTDQTTRLRDLGDDLARLAKGLATDQHAIAQTASALEWEVRQARMLPFAEVCQGLERAARDLAAAAGKEIDLRFEGTDVEMDRSVLEGLKDPLLQLLRNAVDHGIEPAAVRRRAGKPERGRIVVQATLSASRIQIGVSDDGRGLDLNAIREQARKRSLSEPVGDELLRLVFLPGFSTVESVTEVSGRGIGLDIARSQVEALRGTIAVSTDEGRGTRFDLSLPLTLTTLRALIVSAGGQSFALDSTSVEAIKRVAEADLRSIEGCDVVLLENGPVPILSLAGALGLVSEEVPRSGGKVPIVVLSAGARRAAFVVDELLAEQEVLVKSLGARLIRVRNVSAATTLPTGRVALILNSDDLVQGAHAGAPGGVRASLATAPLRERRRLLVADDSVTTRTLEASILEAAGYEVLVAVDGADAWRLLQEKEVDLVVADVEMPRMDGFELTRTIRASKRFRDLPVILVTALETEKHRTEGLQAGANLYLVKSGFDQKVLLDSVEQLL